MAAYTSRSQFRRQAEDSRSRDRVPASALFGSLLFGLACSACGSEAPSEQQSASIPAANSANESKPSPIPQAPRAGEGAGQRRGPLPHADQFEVELNGPVRVVPGHPSTIQPEWGDDLRNRILAEGDDSAGEILAVRIETALPSMLQALLDARSVEHITEFAPEFEGFTNCAATYKEIRFEDATYIVRQGALSEQTLKAGEFGVGLRQEGWTNTRVTASVVALNHQAADQSGSWSLEVEVRVVGEIGTVPAVCDMVLVVQVSDSEANDPKPRIHAIHGRSARLIQRKSPAFQAISGDVFGGLRNWGRELGLGSEDYFRISDRRNLPAGTGIMGMALGDVNGDGLEDIYVSQRGGFPNRLLLHQPDGTVIDGAREAGVDVLDTTRGALLVDLDGDQNLDLALARSADIVVFWNQGNGQFSKPQLLDGPGDSPIYSLCAADPDRDGDLDLYASRYPVGAGEKGVPTPYHDAKNGAKNLYWQNEGERKLRLAGEELGLDAEDPRYSFCSLWEDFTGDGLVDLYVVNDFGPNNLFVNEGGKFVDRAADMGMLDACAGMGITVADVEMDGDLDVYVTNMYSAPGLRATVEKTYRPGEEEVRTAHYRMAEGNSLLLQDKPGDYQESGVFSGVNHGGWAWGAVFYDWNSDGLPDLYVPNGFITSKKETDVESLFWRWIVRITPPAAGGMEEYFRNWGALSFFNQFEGYSYNGYERNHVYLNMGNAEYADVSPISDADYLDDGRVASRVDWDGDGYEDLLLVNRTGPRLRLLRNLQGAGSNRIAIELTGKNGPAGAIGARVRVTRADGKPVTRTVYAGEGLLGQSSTRLFFGLGDQDAPVQVDIRWPDGEEQSIESLAPNRGWEIHQGGENSEWAFKKSPFEGRAGSGVEPNPRGVERCALAASMPLRSLTFSRDDGMREPIGKLGTGPKLLVLWDPDSRSGEAFLRQLATITGRIANNGTTVIPVSLEGESDGMDVLQELGFSAQALQATASDLMVIESLLMEAINTYDSIDLPLSLLLDENSRLCALYYGAIRSEDLLKDLRAMARRPKGSDATLALSGGYWLGQPKRRYKLITRSLMMLGARDLAKDLKRDQ
jgi:hypothetical protein